MRNFEFPLALGLICWLGIGSPRVAHAAPAPGEAAAPVPAKDEAANRRPGFETLANLGFGASTSQMRDLDLEPYGLVLGLDLGYRFRPGFRLGASVSYGFGRSTQQRKTSLRGTDYDLTTEGSSLTSAVTLGYDVPTGPLTLRYSLGLGVVAMWWDFAGIPPESFLDGDDLNNPALGFYLAPGATLLWHRRAFELGVGFDYLVQTSGVIPAAFVGKVVTGFKW